MRTTRWLSAAVGAIVASLTIVATTGANAVGPGKTTLVGDPDTLEALADMSIEIEPTGQAEFSRRGIRFPVSGGDISPQDGFKGLVVHSGGVMLSRASDGASVKFSKLSIIIIGDKAKLFAKANGTEMRFMSLKDGELGGTDTSFQLKDAEATLAEPAAELMSAAFDFPFRKGIPLGTTTTKAIVDDSPSER